MSRPWTHWATSHDLKGLRLTVHDAGTGLTGRSLGVAQFGGAFVLDPFDAYRAGLVSNPNVIVSGAIGAGKSTIVKMMIDRALTRGRRVVVVDPKGEYQDMARLHGARSINLGVDGWCDPFSDDERENHDLLRALIASAQGRPLSGGEHYALDETLARFDGARPVRVLRTLAQMLEPHLGASESSAFVSLAQTLYRFTSGDLAGLFDGDGPPMLLQGRLVVLDVSSQWASDSFGVALLSALAAAQRVARADGELGYLVLDEAWAMLADDHAVRWLRGSWKLARSRGLSHVLVLHRFTDAVASGDAGTARLERVRGLLRECETGWFFRQPPDESREMAVALGLSELEERYLREIPKGVALVRYGRHRSIVRVQPDERDVGFIDTDGAMRTNVVSE